MKEVPTGLDAARRRLRRVVVQVFAVQLATMIGLWLLSAWFGTS